MCVLMNWFGVLPVFLSTSLLYIVVRQCVSKILFLGINLPSYSSFNFLLRVVIMLNLLLEMNVMKWGRGRRLLLRWCPDDFPKLREEETLSIPIPYHPSAFISSVFLSVLPFNLAANSDLFLIIKYLSLLKTAFLFFKTWVIYYLYAPFPLIWRSLALSFYYSLVSLPLANLGLGKKKHVNKLPPLFLIIKLILQR